MADTNDAARASYLNWLKDEVERWCNKDGFFEVEWSYDDSISPDQILDAYPHPFRRYSDTHSLRQRRFLLHLRGPRNCTTMRTHCRAFFLRCRSFCIL